MQLGACSDLHTYRVLLLSSPTLRAFSVSNALVLDNTETKYGITDPVQVRQRSRFVPPLAAPGGPAGPLNVHRLSWVAAVLGHRLPPAVGDVGRRRTVEGKRQSMVDNMKYNSGPVHGLSLPTDGQPWMAAKRDPSFLHPRAARRRGQAHPDPWPPWPPERIP